MHESSYSPPLPLNLSISEKSTELFEGSEWLVTGFNVSWSTHCWSLHFSPRSNWYRQLFISLKHSYLLYSLCLTVSAGLLCFYFFGSIYIQSLRFFNHLINNSHFFFFLNLFSITSFFDIVLILRYKTF